jgi:hypothetical protein
VGSAVVVTTANYIEEHELLWPKIIMPTVAGLWRHKGRREPWNVGNGYIKGYIPMPTVKMVWVGLQPR